MGNEWFATFTQGFSTLHKWNASWCCALARAKPKGLQLSMHTNYDWFFVLDPCVFVVQHAVLRMKKWTNLPMPEKALLLEWYFVLCDDNFDHSEQDWCHKDRDRVIQWKMVDQVWETYESRSWNTISIWERWLDSHLWREKIVQGYGNLRLTSKSQCTSSLYKTSRTSGTLCNHCCFAAHCYHTDS